MICARWRLAERAPTGQSDRVVTSRRNFARACSGLFLVTGIAITTSGCDPATSTALRAAQSPVVVGENEFVLTVEMGAEGFPSGTPSLQAEWIGAAPSFDPPTASPPQCDSAYTDDPKHYWRRTYRCTATFVQPGRVRLVSLMDQDGSGSPYRAQLDVDVVSAKP